MTLNRFHKSGQSSHLFVNGVSRMKEIINVVRKPTTPSMTVILDDTTKLQETGEQLIEVYLVNLILNWDTSSPNKARTSGFMKYWESWNNNTNELKQVAIYLDKPRCSSLNISPRQICNILRYGSYRKNHDNFDSLFSYASVSDDNWWVCITFTTDHYIWTSNYSATYRITKPLQPTLDFVDLYIYERLTRNILVTGIKGVSDFYITKKNRKFIHNGSIQFKNTDIIITKGSNIQEIFGKSNIAWKYTTTNHIREIESMLGIDAACRLIEEEWVSVMSTNNTHVSSRHIKLISDTMCYRGIVCPMTYQGVCKETTSIIKKASFEKAMDSFVWGATQGHHDKIQGCMDTLCWNGVLRAGTGCVKLITEPYNIPKSISDNHSRLMRTRLVKYTPPKLNFFQKYFQLPTSDLTLIHRSNNTKIEAQQSTTFVYSPTQYFKPSSPDIDDSMYQTIISLDKYHYKPTSPNI